VLEFHTFTAQNSSRTEVVTMKIDRLLHKLWEEMSVSGQFCTNITKFTPDLSMRVVTEHHPLRHPTGLRAPSVRVHPAWDRLDQFWAGLRNLPCTLLQHLVHQLPASNSVVGGLDCRKGAGWATRATVICSADRVRPQWAPGAHEPAQSVDCDP
jgi:hypothetical protein